MDATRRTVIGGALALPFAAVPAVTVPSGADCTAWEAALAAYDETSTAFEAAFDACDAVERRFEGMEKPPEVQWIIGRAIPGFPDADGNCSPDYTRAWNEHHHNLVREREAAIARMRAELGVDAAEQAKEQASARYLKAVEALLATPAPDLDALETKIMFVATETDAGAERLIRLAGDVRRLAGKAVRHG